MIEAWGDACVMGTESEATEKTSGEDDAAQLDTASVSQTYP